MATNAGIATQNPTLPWTPAEIKLQIIRSAEYHALPEAWFKFRRICSAWRKETEKDFAERHLPRLRIDLFQDNDEKAICCLHFLQLSQDGTRATFKVVGSRPFIWDFDVHGQDRPFGNLDYVLVLEGAAMNDTQMVGFQCDLASSQVSFEWIPTINLLFGEEMRIQQIHYQMVMQEFEKYKQATDPALMALRGVPGEVIMKRLLSHAIQAHQSYGNVLRDLRVARLVPKHKQTSIFEKDAYRSLEKPRIWKLRLRNLRHGRTMFPSTDTGT
ncbi:hypothetical protein F5X99DRAFT_364316 [Biscogniauxia marginata]|nr:hypothetical protein F5X99DRAFT_364316 [Biscogniauxia marginata]